jgi:YgiT-type zinc finger domain-containing protein
MSRTAVKAGSCDHAALKAGRTSITLRRGRTTIIVRQVPAEMCGLCGESRIDSAVWTLLRELMREAARTGVRFGVVEYQSVSNVPRKRLRVASNSSVH